RTRAIPRQRRETQDGAAEIGPHRRGRRADAHRPVVPEDGRLGQDRPAGGRQRRGEILPRTLDQHLQPLAGEHPGLVHIAPALVGPPDSRLVRRGGKYLRRTDGRRGAEESERQDTYPRPGCAGHLVLVAAGTVFVAWLAGQDAGPRAL